jgi:hypothetical protein
MGSAAAGRAARRAAGGDPLHATASRPAAPRGGRRSGVPAAWLAPRIQSECWRCPAAAVPPPAKPAGRRRPGYPLRAWAGPATGWRGRRAWPAATPPRARARLGPDIPQHTFESRTAGTAERTWRLCAAGIHWRPRTARSVVARPIGGGVRRMTAPAPGERPGGLRKQSAGRPQPRATSSSRRSNTERV